VLICIEVLADAADRKVEVMEARFGLGMVYPEVEEVMDMTTSPRSVSEVFMI